MGGVTDEDLEAVCIEIYDIGNRVWQSPVQGWTDILERALIAYYWLDKQADGALPPTEQEAGPNQWAFRQIIDGVLTLRAWH